MVRLSMIPGIPDMCISPCELSNHLDEIDDSEVMTYPFAWTINQKYYNTPIHEAGHAVIRSALGMTTHAAEILGGNAYLLAGIVHGGPPLDDWMEDREKKVKELIKTTFYQEYTDPVSASLAIMFLAGRIAELINMGYPFHDYELISDTGVDDWLQARHYCRSKRTDATLLACQRICLKILNDNWAAVENIADVLEREARISGYEINTLVNLGSPEGAAYG